MSCMPGTTDCGPGMQRLGSKRLLMNCMGCAVAFEPAGISAVPLWPALPVCERTSEEPPMRALSPLAFDILGDAAVFELREVPRNALVSTCLVSLALKDASGQLQVDA